MDELMLRADEAFRTLKVGRTKGYELLRSGDLPVVRVGRRLLVPRGALEDWVRRHTDRSTEGPGA